MPQKPPEISPWMDWLRRFSSGPWTPSHVLAAIAMGAGCATALLVIPKQCAGTGTITTAADGKFQSPTTDVPFRTKTVPKILKSNATPARKDPTVSSTPLARASNERIAQLPQEAARVEALPDGEEKDEAITALIKEWAEANPAEAAAWVAGLPQGMLKETAGEELARNWTAVDPNAAKLWISKVIGTGQFQGALGVFVNEWSSTNPDEAAKWIESLAFPVDRAVAVASLAQTWPLTDPAAAAQWLGTLPREEAQASLPNLLAGWGERDPGAAAAWLTARMGEDDTTPPEAASALVAQWTSNSPAEVSKWLNSLPDGPLYEVASDVFAQASADKNPTSALAWAKAINEAPRRSNAVAAIFQNWLDDDEAGCLAALPGELDAMEDAALRKTVYDVLIQHDPNFKDQVLSLIEIPDEPKKEEAQPPQAPADPADPFAIPN